MSGYGMSYMWQHDGDEPVGSDLYDGGGFAPEGMPFLGYCPEHDAAQPLYQIEYWGTPGGWVVHSTHWESWKVAQEIIDGTGYAGIVAMRVVPMTQEAA